MRNKDVNMLSGSITKGLIRMTIPIMIMNVMQTMFNIIDMMVLGKFGNDTSVGAVGACGVLATLCTGLLIGISTGSNVVVAKHIGRKDRDGTERAVGASLLFSVVGGSVMMILGVIFAEPILRWTNCPESLLKSAVLYFKMYFIAVPPIMLYNFTASILRSVGDTRRPMRYLIIEGIIKVILNIVFIVIFKMTVAGVALATIIAKIISCVLGLRALNNKKEFFDIVKEKIRFNIKELKEILYVGVPAGLQIALYSLANVVITTAVNSFGPDATTGVSIANNFDGVLYQISCASAVAVIPYVSQNIGAGNIKRAKQSVLKAIMITVCFGATFGALSAIFSGYLSSLMSSTPAVIEYSKQKMIIISSTYFICGINEVMGGALKGMGKPIVPTVATFLFMCVIRFFWVYLIFPLCPNLTFLYLIWPIGWILSITTLLIFFFPTAKKLERTVQVKGDL